MVGWHRKSRTKTDLKYFSLSMFIRAEGEKFSIEINSVTLNVTSLMVTQN
jgi:hypothetical protein